MKKLVFPDVIIYDAKNERFRARKTNEFFRYISHVTQLIEGKEKGQTDREYRLSLSAGWTGLEPATSAVTGQHSNQLNYQPNYFSKYLFSLRTRPYIYVGIPTQV